MKHTYCNCEKSIKQINLDECPLSLIEKERRILALINAKPYSLPWLNPFYQ